MKNEYMEMESYTEFEKGKKFPWKMINWIIAIVLFPFWSMAFIIVSGTSFISFGIAFAFVVALVVANLVLRNHKKALYICRAVTALAVAGGFLPFILLMKFENSKMLYTVKKANYIYGVMDNDESYISFLPEKLPEICDDYTFVTIGCLPIRATRSRLINCSL